MPRSPIKKNKKLTKKQHDAMRSCNWIFTFNNYSVEDIMEIPLLIDAPFGNDNKINYIACAEEVGKKKKTPHLQGFLQTEVKGTFSSKMAKGHFFGWGRLFQSLVITPQPVPPSRLKGGRAARGSKGACPFRRDFSLYPYWRCG